MCCIVEWSGCTPCGQNHFQAVNGCSHEDEPLAQHKENIYNKWAM